MDYFEEADTKIRIRCWNLFVKYSFKNEYVNWVLHLEYDKTYVEVKRINADVPLLVFCLQFPSAAELMWDGTCCFQAESSCMGK